MQVRLINRTANDLIIEDDRGNEITLKPNKPTPFPGDIAPPGLRRLIRIGAVVIEDEPPGTSPPPKE